MPENLNPKPKYQWSQNRGFPMSCFRHHSHDHENIFLLVDKELLPASIWGPAPPPPMLHPGSLSTTWGAHSEWGPYELDLSACYWIPICMYCIHTILGVGKIWVNTNILRTTSSMGGKYLLSWSHISQACHHNHRSVESREIARIWRQKSYTVGTGILFPH